MKPIIKNILIGVGSGAALYFVIKKHCTPDATTTSPSDASDLSGGGGGGGGYAEPIDTTGGDTNVIVQPPATTGADTTPPPDQNSSIPDQTTGGTNTPTGGDTGNQITPGGSGSTLPPDHSTPPPPPPKAYVDLTPTDFSINFAHDGKSDIKYTLSYNGATAMNGTANVGVTATFQWHSGLFGKTNAHTATVNFSLNPSKLTQMVKVNYGHDIVYGTVQLSITSVTGVRVNSNPAPIHGVMADGSHNADGWDVSPHDDNTRNFLIGFGKITK